MGVEFDHFVECESARDVGVRTRRVNRLVRSFSDSIQKPVDFLLFGWWGERVVVCHLCAQLFKQIDVGAYVSPIDMSEVFDGMA